MSHGRLITRDTELEAPEGYKVVLMFGTVTVPIDTPVGANRVIDVTDDMILDISSSEGLPEKYAAWDAKDTAEAVLGLRSMRDHGATADVDRALTLISANKGHEDEAQGLRDKVEALRQSLPSLDVLGMVTKSIVEVLDKKAATK